MVYIFKTTRRTKVPTLFALRCGQCWFREQTTYYCIAWHTRILLSSGQQMESTSPTYEESLRQEFGFLPKDYVETEIGEVFAVVAEGLDEGRVLCQLRYLPATNSVGHSGLLKQTTLAAWDYIRSVKPEYEFYSKQRDASIHGVPAEEVFRHWKPSEFFRAERKADAIAGTAYRIADRFLALNPTLEIGVTGSALLGVAKEDSDLDLTVYGLDGFRSARLLAQEHTQQGRWSLPSDAQMQAAYDRRGCTLSFEEYAWHERRKWNKFVVGDTLLDLTCVEKSSEIANASGVKIGRAEIQAEVADATRSFCHPAEYRVEHSRVSHVLSFTPTYAGQAEPGERIEAKGILEETTAGVRLVIGTTREAKGQLIRVVG